MPLFPFATEHLLEEHDARAITEPYWSELTGVWRSAFGAWRRIDEGDRARLGETSFATPVVLNAYAQSFARERFSGREDEGIVECGAIPSVFAIYITPRVLLRFNGLRRDFVVGNTDRSSLKDSYFRQAPIAGIDGYATRLTVGYVFNEAKADMACVAISLQLNQDPVYHFLIDRTDEGILPIPAPTLVPAPTAPAEQLRKKKPR